MASSGGAGAPAPSLSDAIASLHAAPELAEVAALTAEEITQRTKMLVNGQRSLKSDLASVEQALRDRAAAVKDNEEKVLLNKALPYLVGNVVELLDVEKDEDDAEFGSAMDDNDRRGGKSAVVKTTSRQTVFLPVPGLVPLAELKPGDLIGCNKDSFLILEKLPAEYDARVKAMEVDEKPTEDYTDVGGCDTQIQELVEAIVLPMTHPERFKKLGIKPPKGVLLYGPPGTGKTLLARACAKSTDAVFLKLAGPSLVQMYIGDGAKMVRDAFELAKEKSAGRGGAIIFIDEIDAIGTKRGDSDEGGSREVQRTMLELLSQLDGFTANERVKVIAATNRPDTLDPALLRSGRLDRKIELPHPDEPARVRVLQIHSRKMSVDKEAVNYEELARATEDFNGAMLKAVCVEAGMGCLRRGGALITHEDFVEGVQVVQSKKKVSQRYFA